MKQAMQDVRDFHQAGGAPVLEGPARFPEPERVALRVGLHAEEYAELRQAIAARDIVAVADGIADLAYVLVGTALEFGIPLDRVWAEVHRSNMAKVDQATGKIQRRDDGKILKPAGWQSPDVAGVLREGHELEGEPCASTKGDPSSST